MGFNPNNKKTHYQVDKEYGDGYEFFVSKNQLSNPNKSSAFGDAVGHNCTAFIAYEYKPFVESVKYCFKWKNDKYIQGYRHPVCFDLENNTMSRDHILYALILMKLAGEDEFLKDMGKNLRWKISDRYSFTIESWFWMKGIYGNNIYNKFMMSLYYLIEIPISILYVLWNKSIFLLGGFKKELSQEEYILKSEDELSKRKKKYRKLIYPIYALHLKAFMLYASNNSLGKWLLKRISLMGTDKQNFLLRLMFGGKVKKEDVYSYKSMYGGRWSTSLNDLNDRFLKIISQEELIEENAIDKDILIKMYNNLKKNKK